MSLPGGVRPSRLVAALATLAFVGFVVAPPPAGVTPNMMRAAGAVILAIGLWSTAVVPHYFVSLVFMLVAMLLAIAPAEVVFSGFHAGAMWLVFGGLILSLAVAETGLGARLADAVLRRFPDSYLAILCGLVVVAVGLDFVIPSAAARVTLLVPMVLSLADKLGFGRDSPGRTGLVLAAVMGTLTPAFAILPANVPNMGLAGATESIYDLHLAYGDYFALNFPVLGLASLIAYPILIRLMFADRPRRPQVSAAPSPWRRDERLLLAILLAALALWMTDFAHGIAPAWVALAAGLLCVTPGIGVMPTRVLAKGIDYGPCLFVAGIIGLGAVVTHSGLGGAVAGALLSVVELTPGAGEANFATMVGIGMAVNLLTTMPAAPAIMVPLAETMARASDWPLVSVLMTQVAGWTVFPFPYQAPPIVIAIGLAGLRIGAVTRLLVAYMALGLLVVLPLHYLWGRWLGVFS